MVVLFVSEKGLGGGMWQRGGRGMRVQGCILPGEGFRPLFW